MSTRKPGCNLKEHNYICYIMKLIIPNIVLTTMIVFAFCIVMGLVLRRCSPEPPPNPALTDSLRRELTQLQAQVHHFETIRSHLQAQINYLHRQDSLLQLDYEQLSRKQQQRQPQYEAIPHRINALSSDSLYRAIEQWRPDY